MRNQADISEVVSHIPSLKSSFASSKTSVSLLLEGLSISSLFSERKHMRETHQRHENKPNQLPSELDCPVLLTLHCVDEFSVLAPYFSSETRVIIVRHFRWAEARCTFVPITSLLLLLVSFPAASSAILPGSFLFTAASRCLHVSVCLL